MIYDFTQHKRSPIAFRNSNESIREIIRQSFESKKGTERQQLPFEIAYLPDFEFLNLEYRGSYDDILGIKKHGNNCWIML